MLVIIDHTEGFRFEFGMPSFWANPAVAMWGQLGVTLFFVLSGFLITYLLLAEKEKLGQIKFGAFYLRRALRIWPLYYVVLMLGLFVFPHISFFYFPKLTPLVTGQLATKTALYAFMLPNVAKELYPAVPYLSQAWSIGVEEQFYIIWPILVHFSRRYFRNFLLLAGAVYVVGQLSWFLTAPSRQLLPINELTTFVKNFLFFFRIQSMAIGGIFALVLFREWMPIIKPLTSKAVQAGLWVLLPVMVGSGVTVPYITHELYSVLFGVLILNLALTDTSIVNLRAPILDYLGRVSYGLYMLHPVAIVIGLKLVNTMFNVNSTAHHAATYVGAVLLSIGLAAASYHFLEKPFLTLKKRFTRIKSG